MGNVSTLGASPGAPAAAPRRTSFKRAASAWKRPYLATGTLSRARRVAAVAGRHTPSGDTAPTVPAAKAVDAVRMELTRTRVTLRRCGPLPMAILQSRRLRSPLQGAAHEGRPDRMEDFYTRRERRSTATRS